MTEIDIRPATAEEARHLTDRIKIAVEGTWQLIQEAYLTRSWSALGYGSWDEYCTREFGTSRLRLPREERQEAVASLRESGLSLRAIAAATGQSLGQVQRDLSTVSPGRENDTVETERNSKPTPSIGIDGKSRVYPSSRPRPQAELEPLDPESWPTGNDRDMPRTDPQPQPRPSSPQPVSLYLSTHDGQTVRYRKPVGKATFNESSGDGISWAAWSWNPVTGCLHGCKYCYARSIANRWPDAYPAGFTPLRHEERLDAPANTTIPAAHRDDPAYKRVFVCSMADLYGRWVPDEWISQVHRSMLSSPQWQYILLTKFPARYVGLELPPGAWVGTSVDEQKRVRIAENAFQQIDGVAVKWLSLEPLLEPLEFTDLSMFDWVVIGGQTQTQQPDGTVPAQDPPSREYVMRLTLQAKEAGCAVHWKPNIRKFMWYDEYPAGPEGSLLT
jgi:protein gp37